MTFYEFKESIAQLAWKRGTTKFSANTNDKTTQDKKPKYILMFIWRRETVLSNADVCNEESAINGRDGSKQK